MQPVLTYALDPQREELHTCLAALRQLEDEDPQLHVTWSEPLQELRVQVMGTIQLEVLQQILQDRFQLTVKFGTGSILYQETITQAVEGVGHFEPLRHYAEVHLLLSPHRGEVGFNLRPIVHWKCLAEIGNTKSCQTYKPKHKWVSWLAHH